MQDDALWYEAAQLVGITNALNVIADGLGPLGAAFPAVASDAGETGPGALLGEIAAFYEAAEVWAATRRAFSDNRLSRRLKESLAFAVSLTSRSAFGTAFHLREMRRLGVGERGVMEIIGVTQMFSSYTKIADTLQLEPDMEHIAPV